MFGPEYVKINTVFKRDERNVIVPGDWSLPEFEYLKDCAWRWTEKVDGTNIRVHWNGERVVVGGRTDNAQVPTFLIAALSDFVSDTARWSATFPDSPDVTVYGEGYGPKIQSGGQYRSDPALIVFDVKVGQWWLRPDDVFDVATKLGLAVVPSVGNWTLRDAIDLVRDEQLSSSWQGARIEGIVGTPAVDLFDRGGHRIIAKIKGKDFADLKRLSSRKEGKMKVRCACGCEERVPELSSCAKCGHRYAAFPWTTCPQCFGRGVTPAEGSPLERFMHRE